MFPGDNKPSMESWPQNHLVMLETSAVDREIAITARCRSIESVVDLQSGFDNVSEVHVRGILFPLHPTDTLSSVVLHYRLDKPQEIKGRSLKYLFPKGKNAQLTIKCASDHAGPNRARTKDCHRRGDEAVSCGGFSLQVGSNGRCCGDSRLFGLEQRGKPCARTHFSTLGG
jgi:hypothetical protein